ncbi:MAG TPA: hypothetical protein RMH99_01780 [Sandaracinaceae bacterium LLY-WYZ-13_1]|nr:hypothetical protein [Sandaracinaceae bacterium LLY-WYZ-13_1]
MSSRRRLRLVDRLVLAEGPAPASALTDHLITARTRLLVLDLDRTTHLGRNMGELLGWEVGAFLTYGRDELRRMEAARTTGRLIFDRARPLASLRYLTHGARTWAGPGLYYLFFGKIAARTPSLRRLAHRAFGPDPIRVVQRVPQNALLRVLSTVPAATQRSLAERVWDRHASEQVLDRAELARLRERAPDLTVVVSSASPQVMVEVARQRLGADVAHGSTVGRINSGPAKIARLEDRFSELMRDPSVEKVGITDTGYGEDRCWVDHLTRVADVNSVHPFSPIVMEGSPVREICSAQLMTHGERERRARAPEGWADPRRVSPVRERERVFERPELERRLGDLLARAERLAAHPARYAWELDELLREARARLDLPEPVASDARPEGGAAALDPTLDPALATSRH